MANPTRRLATYWLSIAARAAPIAMGEWLSPVEFAALVGIRRQVAHRALLRRRWRENPLEMRKVHGRRGGYAGEQYQVNSTSLPLVYQHRLKASQTYAESHPKSITGR